jgi:hypothetical protein
MVVFLDGIQRPSLEPPSITMYSMLEQVWFKTLSIAASIDDAHRWYTPTGKLV